MKITFILLAITLTHALGFQPRRLQSQGFQKTASISYIKNRRNFELNLSPFYQIASSLSSGVCKDAISSFYTMACGGGLFKFATVMAQPFWLLLTFAPNRLITARIVRPWVLVILSIMYAISFALTSVQSKLSCSHAFGVAMHILTWDLFIGRFIWLGILNLTI